MNFYNFLYMDKLKDKVSLITGAGRGIGRGIAIAMAKAGSSVIPVSRSLSELEETCRVITESGGTALHIKTDISDEIQVNIMIKKALDRFGKIDILINNAGQYLEKPVLDTTVEDWEKIMGANLKGIFLCTKGVLKGMMERKGGIIINFSSVGGRIGLKGKAVYSASKFGVVGFSKALAKELKPYNIKVHIIYPYMVDSNNSVDWSKGNPLNINKVEDIADLVVSLVSLPLRVNIEDIIVEPYLGCK
ncbi:MAG: SDR family oxidoreductase [Nitrospinae bacterium]|nr:SDR family oxidoreductase [Nitrospinota bacterium]